MKSRRELKKQALALLAGQWWPALSLSLILAVVAVFLGWAGGVGKSFSELTLAIFFWRGVQFFWTGVASAVMADYFWRVSQGSRHPDYAFGRMGKMIGSVLALQLGLWLVIFGPVMGGLAAVLLVLSGLYLWLPLSAWLWVAGIILALALLLALGWVLVASVRYAQTWWVWVESGYRLSPLLALRRSRLLMRGHEREFLWLSLSFLGWLLLGVVTVGVGLVAVMPYIEVALALYCQGLLAEQERE